MFALLFRFAWNFAIAEYVTESNGGFDAQAILVPPTLPSTATGSTIRRPQAQQSDVLSLLFPLELRLGFYYSIISCPSPSSHVPWFVCSHGRHGRIVSLACFRF